MKGLTRRVQDGAWRLRNLPRVVRHRFDASEDGRQPLPLEELRREGIVIRPSGDFANGAEFFQQASARAHHLWAQARAGALGSERMAEGSYGRKDYKLSLLSMPLPLDDPFVQMALHPGLLTLANRYLGMRSQLRAIELWWDRPTPGEAKETQLWHRDGDDVMNVKAFVYFTDVDLESGPFCFIPRSHPCGERRRLAPEHDVHGRTTDEQMARLVSQPEWRVCLGTAGTVAICDTCGYHKGLKPTQRERLMLMIQYTSQTPRYPRVLRLTDGRGMGMALTAAQRDAGGDVDGTGSGR